MNSKMIIAGLLLTSVSIPAAAAPRDKPFSFELAAGAEYDSRLSVEEIDVESNVGDLAAVFGAQAEYKKPLQGKAGQGKAGELNLGYGFDQKRYAKHNAFDTQSHRLTAGGALRAGKANLGADFGFHHVRRGGDPLLDMRTFSPSISGFVADKLFLRAYYSYFDKDFARSENRHRDAEAQSVGMTVNRFFKNPRGYVSFGARLDDEDAVEPALDYDGYLLSANLQLPLTLDDGDGKVNFGYTYRKRDYDNITPSIDARRHENRSVFRVRTETPLGDKFGLETEYRYTDRNSNFPSADYSGYRVSAAVSYQF